jgi:hypothetical protein
MLISTGVVCSLAELAAQVIRTPLHVSRRTNCCLLIVYVELTSNLLCLLMY